MWTIGGYKTRRRGQNHERRGLQKRDERTAGWVGILVWWCTWDAYGGRLCDPWISVPKVCIG